MTESDVAAGQLLQANLVRLGSASSAVIRGRSQISVTIPVTTDPLRGLDADSRCL